MIHVAIVTGTLVVSSIGGWPIISAILRHVRGTPSHVTPSHTDDNEPGPALRGGTWIGILERVAVTMAILAGFPAGIAVVVAIKGLGRFPELQRTPGNAETFMIGSLASLIWASAAGFGGVALMHL
jgi:hypothetical protein